MNEQLKAIHNGCKDALSDLLKELEPQIYRSVYRKISHEQDARDITQEVMVRIYRNIQSFKGDKAKITTWVHLIIRNLCFDYFRRKRTHITAEYDADEVAISSGDRVDEHIVKSEFSNLLSEALTQLPLFQREAFLLRHFEDRSYNEICEQMKIPLNTVKSYILRARKSLQSLLQDYYRIA